ncbi:hypothetical protein CHS0354_009390 [Potamilus streckersoni]|uniref:PH domain-containing protein n=1 Tax=Potamilus streckersoni TaxID=2493646 RepID=A0AAE0T418_9BIVA|nr:hypothetical protein CHS0354_009390 [Potamilus streckersoni]
MTDSGFKKCGLIDVKQPAKTRGRKLKSWKKRWLVVHKIPNPAAGTYVTQIDIYPSDEAAKNKIDCKQRIILENLTAIQPVKSKTHKFAVEVVEREPVLLLAGETELESQEWVEAIRQIFRARNSNHFIDEKDIHRATVIKNKDTSRLGLGGEYQVHVSPEYISIHSLDSYNSYEWSLKTLKRFQLLAENNNILMFECGPASESGEATFQFMSAAALKILATIKKNIFVAISLKQNMQKQISPEEIDFQDKSPSNSVTNSEKILRGMLQNCNQSRKEPIKPLTPENDAVSTDSTLSVISSSKSTTSDLFISLDVPSISTRLGSVETLQSTDSRGNTNSLLSETPMTNFSFELPPRSEMADVTPASSEYNTLDEFASKRVSMLTNFSVAPVEVDSQNSKFFLDEYGYSHVNIQTNITSTTYNKGRTLSNHSTASSVSFRTNSTNSRDSGVVDSPIFNATTVERKQKLNHRPTDSFDSAISTSSINEDPAQTFKLSIEEIEICLTDEAHDNGKEYGYSVLYQHKNNHTRITDNTNTAAQHRKPSLQKSNSTGNVVLEENIYEDVDKYRKNLEKFLGLDPKIDPSAIPPSLPERPPTLKPRRKLMNMSANSRSSERKLFTFPRLSMSKGKKKDNPSYESDEESSEFREGPSKVAFWPLGAMSVTDENELYQGVAKVHGTIESRPIARQRSNSLNVSVFSTRKQKSQEQRKKDSVDLLTGDNLPEFLSSPVETKILCPGMFGPNSNSTPYDPENGIHIDWARKQTSYTYGQDVSLFDDLLSSSEENLRYSLHFSEEPIYAEVKSHALADIPFEPPFPDIAHWYPHHDSMDYDIKEPELDNKSDLAVLDLFHFGFNFPMGEETRSSKDHIENSLSLGSILSESSVFSELTDNIYTDMSFCANDDVYVLPSNVVQVNK